MEPQKVNHFRNNWVSYLLLILLIGTSTFLWLSKNNALDHQEVTFLEQQSADRLLAQQTLDSFNIDQLTVTMKALVWAVRSEMVRENMEQVDQYFRQFVKTKGVNDVTLLDGSGIIQLSTNKKVEGEAMEGELAVKVLAANDVAILDDMGSEHILIIAPVMSLNNRLGTLMVSYERPTIDYPLAQSEQ